MTKYELAVFTTEMAVDINEDFNGELLDLVKRLESDEDFCRQFDIDYECCPRDHITFNSEAELHAYLAAVDNLCFMPYYEYEPVSVEESLCDMERDIITLSADDLTQNFDCSSLSNDEIDNIMSEIQKHLSKSDNLYEAFWDGVEYVATKHRLSKIK